MAPADAVTLHWAELPSRSAAQATAAARILASEASASPLAELHVAVGDEGATDRPIGVVGAATMRDWLLMLAEAGVDPVAVIPAPMLLPRPEEGYARAELAGSGVVRGTSSGFADEARLTELVTGGTAPATVDRDTLEAAIVAAVASPPLDLRQGPFARRRRFAIDWGADPPARAVVADDPGRDAGDLAGPHRQVQLRRGCVGGGGQYGGGHWLAARRDGGRRQPPA
ncbi:type II secretion system protein GspL [Sphingomonas sp. H160509]|uniref:type II secretion system protein GspL n=1 Tax=Sphingomonas sp. H160509 TaxID=2955313 RepID=UPI002097AED2|nr:type II secretion system protein GspL [Sphingomonas sp. H160509]